MRGCLPCLSRRMTEHGMNCFAMRANYGQDKAGRSILSSLAGRSGGRHASSAVCQCAGAGILSLCSRRRISATSGESGGSRGSPFRRIRARRQALTSAGCLASHHNRTRAFCRKSPVAAARGRRRAAATAPASACSERFLEVSPSDPRQPTPLGFPLRRGMDIPLQGFDTREARRLENPGGGF